MTEPLDEPVGTFMDPEPAGDDSEAEILEPGTLDPVDEADEDA